MQQASSTITVHQNRHANQGFALVVSLTMLVLLTVIAVGLLSLSAITLRTTSQNSEQAEAQANARMALMIAIGELQRTAGPDTRVTAKADIVDQNHPPVLGVWRSWEGTNHDANGRPIAPSYGEKEQSESGGGRFLNWLVSSAALISAPSINDAPTLVLTSATDNTVPLLADGSLQSTDPRQVHVVPTESQNGGRFAWWVSGENQKARLAQPHDPRANDAAGWADLGKSHATPDPSPFGLETLLDDPEEFHPAANPGKPGQKALTLQTTALIAENNPDEPQFSFHDLSTSAVGLLTNTATGGWRKDLSILTENWDQIYTRYPGGRLPLFRYTPEAGETSAVPRVTTNNYDPAQSNFYPWSGYSQIGANKLPITYSAASASWQSLVNFTTKYKSVSYDASSKTGTAPIGWNNVVSSSNAYTFTNGDFFKHYHDLALNPVVARIQLIFQANALKDIDPYDTIENPNLFHRINLRIVPVITLWNPYNVEITKAAGGLEYGISTTRSLPLGLSITNATAPPTGAVHNYYKLINDGSQKLADGLGATSGRFDRQMQLPGTYAGSVHFGSIREMCAWLPKEFSLKPGEVKVFTPEANTGSDPQGVQHYFAQLLKEGYDLADDYGMLLTNPDNLSKALAGTQPQNVGTLNNHADAQHILASRFIKVPTSRPNLDPRPFSETTLKAGTNPPNQRNQLHASDAVKFEVKADRLSKIFTDSVTTKKGAGIDFMVGTRVPDSASGGKGGRAAVEDGKTNLGMSSFHSVQAMSIDPRWAKDYWPATELDKVEYTVSDLVPGGGNPPWTNLFTVSFGPRISFGAAAGSAQNRTTKGLLQSNPFANNAFSIPEQTPNNHPVNGAYDISYHAMAATNDNLTPEVGTAGYIATGFQMGDGLSRLIISEIPLRPMASLAELQNWNLRGNNPLPPHQFYLIGNSDATPLILQNGILPSSPTTDPATNLQHDDAYCANHLLFDDWFLSSIAPQPTAFGNAIARDINAVYRDFLRGNSPLTNRAYRPIGEDRNLSAADATARIGEILDSPDGDGWLKVASRFEVDGMFNVNSTSVKAWRALLSHARNQQVALHGENGIELDPTKHNHVVSRHTVAADVKAGDDAGLGAAFPSGSEYSGFRTLSESQLDELAERIVDQVRLRGPFLSLSEFVNRQLGSDDDLALAGALQVALNSLTDDPNETLSNPGNGLSDETMAANDAKLVGAGYAFAQASEGVNTYGFPGWIRQADVLRPIAPVLSVRDDTFTIRAYGDARDANGKVIARAWCEATVQRTRDFIDPQDPADSIDPPASTVNRDFGRKFTITSFRWLNIDEI